MSNNKNQKSAIIVAINGIAISLLCLMCFSGCDWWTKSLEPNSNCIICGYKTSTTPPTIEVVAKTPDAHKIAVTPEKNTPNPATAPKVEQHTTVEARPKIELAANTPKVGKLNTTVNPNLAPSTPNSGNTPTAPTAPTAPNLAHVN